MDQSVNRQNLLQIIDGKLSELVDSKIPKQSEFDLKVFRNLYEQFLNEPSKIEWSSIEELPKGFEISYADLAEVTDRAEIEKITSKVAVIKLNGGLGTTMGCKGPKSLITMRKENFDGGEKALTFLDFALLQNSKLNKKWGTSIPLILMNSFNTADATQEALNLINDPELTKNVWQFNQSRCPRIYADTLLPVPTSYNDCLEDGWYPPGHGNVLASLSESGVLDALIAEGRTIAFVSNIDNTGAVFDFRLAKAMTDGVADYMMENTLRTAADIKGGTLIKYKGLPMHLECPQVPSEKLDEFCSLKRFKMFNTNNIWLNLLAVKKIAHFKMEILANKKTITKEDGSSHPVIQLETSIGGSIRNFPGRALSVVVDRERFLPVKNAKDLFRLMNHDFYKLCTNDGTFVLRKCWPKSEFPSIELPSPYFDSVYELLARIPEVPRFSKEVCSFQLCGDVYFGRNVQLNGINIRIVSPKEKCLKIPDNSLISDETYNAQI